MFTRKIGGILTLAIALSLLVSLFVFAEGPVPTVSDGPGDKTVELSRASHRLIVELQSPSLAVWYKTAPAAQAVGGRLDVSSSAAKDYIAQLEAEQAAFVEAMRTALPDATVAAYINENGEPMAAAYQVVMNAVTIDPGTNDIEAAMRALRQVTGVKNVYRDYEQKPAMYASIPLIDAPALWQQLGGQDVSGEGILIASIDTGVYAPNPFFDPAGYSYPPGYPVGNPMYTTKKVIGARAYFRPWDPPTAGDETPWPGPAGSSHGTHTSGTFAGNAGTIAETAGLTNTISGVAPRAQILSYRIGYPTNSEYSGSAFDTEIVMAYEDAVMDGADVINYSFGGYSGVMPWASATAVARDGAWDAGVFVSHSAGNEGPGGSTTTDASPKVMEAAASSTTGTIASGRFNVTAPEPVPPELLDMAYTVATFGAPLPLGQIVGPFDFVTSDAVDPANAQGCNPWPAGTFDNKAAVIIRGVCEFGVKVLNAEQAGAEFVVIRNHAAGGDALLNMGPGAVGNQVTISSIFVGYTDGTGLVNWYATNGAASQFAVDTFAFQLGSVPDVIASFSSRGPAFARFLEPDVTAPGVNILSSGYAVGATGVDQHMGFGQASGTSMAAPHVAGSAALLRQLHPTWTPTQIRSALMTTAETEVWLDDAHTIPASVLDMGAGRIDLGKAGDPGLTFDSPSLSFGALHAGATKTMTVMATNVSGAGGTYELTVEADAGITVTVSPDSLTFAAGETKSFEVTVDTTAADVGDYGGMVWLDDGTHLNHLPLWVRVEASMGEAKVLLVDNDMSDLLGFPDYTYFYTSTLEALGVAYDYYNADLNFGNPQTLPSAAELAAYDVIIYWSGDNYYPDGSFTVATPLTLLDMQTLTDWQFNGGRLLVTGQDLASAWDALDSSGAGYFIYSGNLGTKWLQDSIFDPGYEGLPPPMPSVVGVPGSPLSGLVLDLSASGDGAANQYYVDEIQVAPYGDTSAPETIKPILAAIDGAAVMDGYLASSRADGPTLEEPTPAFDYRSLYLSFGFEGINNDTGYNTREELMGALYNWLTDELSVSLAVAKGTPMELVTLNATFESSVGAEAVQYRWDFGDGSDIAVSKGPSVVHSYDAGGKYHARVEVTDALGHTAISEPALVNVVSRTYLPLIFKGWPRPPVTFTILHHNDLHGQLEASGSNPGLSRLANTVNNVRAQVGAGNVLLVDAGDEMQGSLLSNVWHGEPVIAAYNLMGYNAATFGNHEFDWGLDVLSDRVGEADYPYVSANIVVNDTGDCTTAGWTSPGFATPYTVVSVGTPVPVTVGFIGVTSQETPYITIAEATEGLCFKDPAASILHYYDELDAKVDVIVVLSHLGFNDGGYGYGFTVYGDKTLAQKLNGASKPVNLIIGGHSHTDLYPLSDTDPTHTKIAVIGNTTVVQAHYNGRKVGRADITVSPEGAVSVAWQRLVVGTSDPQDPAVQALINTYANDPDYLALINEPIGYAQTDLLRNYNGDAMMGDFIDDAIYNQLNSDAEPLNDVDMFFNNAGGIRIDWCDKEDPANPGSYIWSSDVADCSEGLWAHDPMLLNYGQMFQILPFGNATIVGDMTGAQILDLLNQSATLFKGAIQPAGIRFSFYRYSDALPGPQPYAWGAFDACVIDKIDGSCDPLEMDRTYRVGTNEFLAPAGQDGFIQFKYLINTSYWGDMLNSVNAYVSEHYGTPATAYKGPDGDGTLDGRVARDGTDATGSIVPITILHHNDSHGNLVKTNYVGYTQLAAKIIQERAHNPDRTLLLNGGDSFQGDSMMYFFKSAALGYTADGTPLTTTLQINPLLAAFNYMDYDAMTLGNHEFNFGHKIFTSTLRLADFPVLQANLEDDGSYGIAEVPVRGYVTKTVGAEGIKVAILGIGNHRVPNYELPSNIPGLTFTNPISKAQELSDALRPTNDVVLALSHIGFTEQPGSVEIDKNVDTFMAATVTGLDTIIGSHSHTNPLSGFGTYKFLPTIVGGPDNTPVIINHAYRYNAVLGEVVLGMRSDGSGGWDVASRAGRYIPIALTDPEDATIKAMAQPYVDLLAAYNNKVIGQTTAPIDALQAYTQETNGANLQADAAVWELEEHNGIPVDFHLSGAMSNRKVADGATPGSPYTLKVSDMFTLMPYENSLVVMEMNGPQLKAVLERAYRNYYYYKYVPGQGGYSYYTTCMIDINAGGVITYDDTYPSLPNGNNVVSLVVDGTPVDLTDAATYYNVSTVNYLAAGSCNFNDGGVSLWPLGQIVNDTQFYVRDAVIYYIEDQGTVSPAIEGRLVFQ